MINKLPKWILYGGCLLAFNAGCVNSTALIGFTHLSVSHVTGNVTLFASAFAKQDHMSLLMICAVLLACLFGCRSQLVARRATVWGGIADRSNLTDGEFGIIFVASCGRANICCHGMWATKFHGCHLQRGGDTHHTSDGLDI